MSKELYYVGAIKKGAIRQDSECAPLAFEHWSGEAKGPLLRRGYATLFDSTEEAQEALRKTLAEATALGQDWPTKYTYLLVKAFTLK